MCGITWLAREAVKKIFQIREFVICLVGYIGKMIELINKICFSDSKPHLAVEEAARWLREMRGEIVLEDITFGVAEIFQVNIYYRTYREAGFELAGIREYSELTVT